MNHVVNGHVGPRQSAHDHPPLRTRWGESAIRRDLVFLGVNSLSR